MRSAQHLDIEIELRGQIQRLRGSRDLDQWDRVAYERNARRIRHLRAELEAVSGDLEWIFDGLGIYGNRIALNRLNHLSDPLARALRWTARDILFMEWLGTPGGPISEAIEPLVAGTINGSFGLRLTRPDNDQGSLFDGSLFDSAVEKVLAAFESAVNRRSADQVFEAIRGLRSHAINGIRELSIEMAKSEQPSRVRWKRDRVLTISPNAAQGLAEVLYSVGTREEEIVVHATLEGADLLSGRFHLLERTSEKHYRGKVEPSAVADLRGLGLGTDVTATLVVVTLESRTLEEPKESYALRSFAPTDPSTLLR